jgi:FtsH-binding integral membrane protein
MENKDLYDEINSIKKIMERSTKFISLSGLSGIMAGVYALVGAGLAYQVAYVWNGPDTSRNYGEVITMDLIPIAVIVLLLSIGTGILLTVHNAKRKGQTVWNPSSKALLKNGLLPLLSGGVFILILVGNDDYTQYYAIIAPSCLIFYGLALTAASQYTYGDVKWLGITEIILGLLAMMLPGFDLLFWALGFGVMYILYGSIMYFKYDRENNAD